MRKLLFLTGIFISCCTHPSFSQTSQIKGIVVDAKDGSPLQGVTVKIKGGNAVSSGIDGSFLLKTDKPDASIEYSFVGYTPKTQKARAGESIRVSLETDTRALSEVVVTGVGVATSKKKLGISVESVTADKLPAAPTASVDQALIGKIPGAQISSVNGSPGARVNILLRGINTLNRGTQPMILLDGIEVAATDLNSLDLSGVERVEVVEGAAAATIYGAQGANGVIQLFSKKGKPGKIKIEVSSSVSSNTLLNVGNLHKSAFHSFTTNANGEVVSSTGVPLSLDKVNMVYANPTFNLVDTGALQNKPYNKNLQYVDHFKMFLQTAYTTNNSISIGGAREKVDFNISASDNRQNSNFKGNGNYSRSNLLSNIGIEIAKNLRFRSVNQLVYTKNTQIDQTGRTIFYSLNNSRPFANYDLKDSLGNYGIYYGDAVGVNSSNPNYRTQYTHYNNEKIDVVQNFNLNYKPFHWIELDAKYGLNYQTQDIVQNILPQDNNANAAYNKSWRSNYFTPTSRDQTGEIDNYRYRTTFQNFLGTATFRTDFANDFHINIPLKTTTQASFDYRKNMYKEYITYGADAPSFTPYTASQMVSGYKIQSDYTEPFITYGYLVNQRFEIGDFAGISGGIRSDYSSAFGRGSKPFTFPRGDAYLRISELSFWSNAKIDLIIPEFKIRAAYGKAGIQPKPFDRYVTLNTRNVGSNVAFNFPTTSSNPDLSVEISGEFEIGTDLSFHLLNGEWLKSANLSATYWNRSTKNAIWNVDVAPSTGLGTVKSNAFSLASSGVQASLNLAMLGTKNFNWNLTTNFSKQSSKITSVIGSQIVLLSNAGSSNYVLKAGDKVGQLFGYLMIHNLDEKGPDGIEFISKAEQANYTVASNGWVVNKATRQPYVTSKQYPLGDPNPAFLMSFINDFSFKNALSVSMQWDWLSGNRLYNQTKEWMYRDGIHGDYADPITIDGHTGAYTAFYRGVYAQVSANGTKNYFYEDASFMRLRNLSVAFDIAQVIKLPAFQRLQLVLSGRNLVTFTKYSGMDPEISSGTVNSAWDRGVDHNTIPNIKTYQVGLNLGF
ncbi:MAG: SusC/RagA family TonB-linked outer membrane protein [Williamsia sp.]|nr:SusC/RagA family TonB-linked outer membrane protein [Williamsia sp.]